MTNKPMVKAKQGILPLRVYLKVSQFDRPFEAVSRIVGTQPTRTFKTGDLKGKSKIRRKFNEWHLETNLKSEKLEDHVLWLKENVNHPRDLQKSEFHIQLVCVLHIGSHRPALELSADSVEFLSSLNCGLWIDYYVKP